MIPTYPRYTVFIDLVEDMLENTPDFRLKVRWSPHNYGLKSYVAAYVIQIRTRLNLNKPESWWERLLLWIKRWEDIAFMARGDKIIFTLPNSGNYDLVKIRDIEQLAIKYSGGIKK